MPTSNRGRTKRKQGASERRPSDLAYPNQMEPVSSASPTNEGQSVECCQRFVPFPSGEPADPDAEPWLLNCRDLVLRYLLRNWVLLGAVGADDIAQNTLLILVKPHRWERLRTLQEKQRLAYAFTTARRLVGKLKRRRANRTTTHLGDNVCLLPDTSPPTDEAIAQHEGARAVIALMHSLIATLPPKERAVFVAYRLNGLGYSEVAQQLGIREGTARMRGSRAHTRIRELLRRRGCTE